MAKRKNPLKDLDAFLKQESQSLVPPERVATPEPVKSEKNIAPAQKPHVISEEEAIHFLTNLSARDSSQFLSTLLSYVEKSEVNISQKAMLINTFLYLKHPDSWKEKIADYWS